MSAVVWFLKSLTVMTKTVADVIGNIVAVLFPIVIFEIFWWPIGRAFYKKSTKKSEQAKLKQDTEK